MGETIKWSELDAEERDRLVATKIMGWQPVQCDEDIELTIYDDGDAWCPRCHAREHINAFEHGIIPHPAYTRSMDAAWQVIQMLYGMLLFSNRRVFLRKIQQLVTEASNLKEPGMLIDWPDVFLYITPEIICQSALFTMEVSFVSVEKA